MGYTLGQAAKAVGMSKTSILRSIKTGRISAGRDEFGQWAIEPCELHRVYPPLADDTGTGTGSRHSHYTRHPGRSTTIRFQIDAERHPRATGPLAAAGGTAGGTRDHGSAEGTLTRAASVVAANAPSSHRSTTVSMGCGPPLWGRSAFNCSFIVFLTRLRVTAKKSDELAPSHELPRTKPTIQHKT
jgi:hypothetical protein